MGDVHISPDLDRDQRIFRPISFYDLIDLMTFSQLTFNRSHRMRAKAGGFPARTMPLGAERADVMLQSWTLFDDESDIDWNPCDASSASIYLVSSIQALSASLFPGKGTEVLVERTCRIIHVPSQSQSVRRKTVSLYDDETLSVIVSNTDQIPPSDPRPAAIRLLVDLRTLLIGVMVSPAASIRYLELVSQIVQRTTHAFVSRASQPMAMESITALSARRA